MIENIKHLISSSKIEEIITTISKPRSNWRRKVYPKPRIWVTKETLKYRNKKYGK